MPENTHSFKYKPALLAKTVNYNVFDDRLEWNKAGQDVNKLYFIDIKSVRFAVTIAREYRFRRLDLSQNNGEILKIAITSSRLGTRENDEYILEYYGLLTAISGKLGKAKPDLQLIYSETQKALWIMFSVGVIAVLAAAGMFGLAIATNVSDRKLRDAMVPMSVLALFGVYTCITSNPFKPKPVMKLEAFMDMIQKL